MARYMVGLASEIPPGERKIVDVKGRSIGIFNINGKYYALLNRCPHQGAPLCVGRLTSTTLFSDPGEYTLGRHNEILRCPWHGWEFDVTNGQSVFDPFKCRVRSYEVTVESGDDSEGHSEEWPSVETYPVTVESDRLVLHIP